MGSMNLKGNLQLDGSMVALGVLVIIVVLLTMSNLG
jgi:hypothetical protein